MKQTPFYVSKPLRRAWALLKKFFRIKFTFAFLFFKRQRLNIVLTTATSAAQWLSLNVKEQSFITADDGQKANGLRKLSVRPARLRFLCISEMQLSFLTTTKKARDGISACKDSHPKDENKKRSCFLDSFVAGHIKTTRKHQTMPIISLA